MDWTDIEQLNLRDQAAKLKALLDKPLRGNKTWETSVRLCIRTISDYED